MVLSTRTCHVSLFVLVKIAELGHEKSSSVLVLKFVVALTFSRRYRCSD